MKPLLPTLKEKKRYIVYEVVSDVKHAGSSVTNAIEKSMNSFLGIHGLSQAGLIQLPKRWAQSQQRGMLRIKRSHVDHAKAALTMITHIDKKEALIRSVGVSGTIKKAASSWINR